MSGFLIISLVHSLNYVSMRIVVFIYCKNVLRSVYIKGIDLTDKIAIFIFFQNTRLFATGRSCRERVNILNFGFFNSFCISN